MDGSFKGMEKRRFIRYTYKRHINYNKIIFSEDRSVELRLHKAVSRNLSSSGILFTSKTAPELSSTVLLEIHCKSLPIYRSLKEQVFIFNDRLLGKVVRVEEVGRGEYSIGVAFVNRSEPLAREIKKLIKIAKLRKFVTYFSWVVFTLFVVVLTLTLNLLYLEYRTTYHPDKILSSKLTPWSIGIGYEEVNLKTKDNELINGWFVPSKDAKVSVLFCHGNCGNICDWLAKVNFFHSMGVNLFLFDYRGYGKSTGVPTEQGLYKDALTAYDYLASRSDVNKDEIVVVGESMGGAMAAEVCLKRKARALILESAFVSLVMEAQSMYPFLPVQYTMLERYDTLSKIKKILIPKLILHGYDDEIVPFKHAQMLYNQAAPPKKFLRFGGGHSDDTYRLSDAYKAELIKFFSDNNIQLR